MKLYEMTEIFNELFDRFDEINNYIPDTDADGRYIDGNGQTAQGERIALAHSETIPAGATIEFTVRCLKDSLMKAVREWLDYGLLRGLGQWRNSGKG